MHSVCVCQYHQYAKLLGTVIPGITDYKILLYHMVCSLDSRDCMLQAVHTALVTMQLPVSEFITRAHTIS